MEHFIPIFERHLEAGGPVLRIAGLVQMDIAHHYGVPHGTAVVAVIINRVINGLKRPHILLHKRSIYKRISPGAWDICGGHIEYNASDLKFSIQFSVDQWDDKNFIEQLYDQTALREVNEEVRLLGSDFRFEMKHLRRFAPVGAFDQGTDDPAAFNREYSTLYAAFVPAGVLMIAESDALEKHLQVMDSIGMGGVQSEEIAVELRLVSFDDLVLDFSVNPGHYADGIGRILRRVVREPGTLKALKHFLGIN